MATHNRPNNSCLSPTDYSEIDFQRSLSLNSNESFKLIITLIANEFDSKKEVFRGFLTEREFLNSQELKEFIINVKQYIVCWRARPEYLEWLDEYITSLMVGHWRTLSKEPKVLEVIEEIQIDSSLIPVPDEANSPNIPTTPDSKLDDITKVGTENSSVPSRVSFEQLNLRLICTDYNGIKIIEPDPELPATLCLLDNQARSSQAQNYSWEKFLSTFQKLINDEIHEPIKLEEGAVTYGHPSNEMRVIHNQIQFSVALNHLIWGLRGCVASFYFCCGKKNKNTLNHNHTKVSNIETTNGNQYDFLTRSQISIARRRNLRDKRRKSISKRAFASRTLNKSGSRSKYN